MVATAVIRLARFVIYSRVTVIRSAALAFLAIISVAPRLAITVFGAGAITAAVLPIFSLTLPQRRAAVIPAIFNVTVISLTPVVVVAVSGARVIAQAPLSFNRDERVRWGTLNLYLARVTPVALECFFVQAGR